MTMVSAEPLPARFELRDILGIGVADIDWHEAVAMLGRLAEERRFTKIAFLNANNANIACKNAAYHAAMQDYLVLSDGIGVDIAAKVLYGSIFIANLNGTDFIPALLKGIPPVRTPYEDPVTPPRDAGTSVPVAGKARPSGPGPIITPEPQPR